MLLSIVFILSYYYIRAGMPAHIHEAKGEYYGAKKGKAFPRVENCLLLFGIPLVLPCGIVTFKK